MSSSSNNKKDADIMPFPRCEPNKLYCRPNDITIIRAFVGEYIVIFWTFDPTEYVVLRLAEFNRKLKRGGWEQLN